jgi:carbonic anhydrase
MAFKTTAARAILTALTAAFASIGVCAADWQSVDYAGVKVTEKIGPEKIAIDRSRIGYGGAGMVAVWSRLDMLQPVADAEGNYNAIEALNRYDCNSAGNSFVTLKRLYLLDNVLIRVEPVLLPKNMNITAGSVDAAIAADICKGVVQKPQSADVGTVAAGGLMNADAQKADDAAMPLRMLAVADSGRAANTSTTAAPSLAPAAIAATPQRRFIDLPHIDPSQVQHPTDEPVPAVPTKEESSKKLSAKSKAAAIKSEAAKAGVSLSPKSSSERHAREIELATSGFSRRAKAEQLADETTHKDVHWNYEGEGAPSMWARLRPDFGLCDSGQRQSPIDIHEGIHVDLEPIRFDYRESLFRIIDNGHTVQVNVGEGNSISVMGRTYRLLQLHFHRPSEERIDGRSFEMVMHLVHQDDAGHLAVVAVLIEPGAEQPVIQTFWNNLPLETNLELSPATAIDVNKLLPEARTYYTYMGSLTTPPCSEGVLWMVLKKPLQISPEQIAIFSRLYRNNARPIQPANGRLVKDSR